MRLNWPKNSIACGRANDSLCKSSKRQRHTFGSHRRQGITDARSYERRRRIFMIMADQLASDARTAILNSIRAHLAESALHDHAAEDRKHERAAIGPEDQSSSIAVASSGHNVAFSGVEMFREKLEMVGGHCVVVRDEAEAARSLSRILAELQTTPLRARRSALTDAPSLPRLIIGWEG